MQEIKDKKKLDQEESKKIGIEVKKKIIDAEQKKEAEKTKKKSRKKNLRFKKDLADLLRKRKRLTRKRLSLRHNKD